MPNYPQQTTLLWKWKNPCIGNVLYEHQFIKLAREYQTYHPVQVGSNTEGLFGDRENGMTQHYQTVFNAGVRSGGEPPSYPSYTNSKPTYYLPSATTRSRQNIDSHVMTAWSTSDTYQEVPVAGYLKVREYFPITVALYKPYIEAIQAGQVWDDHDPIGFVSAIKYETLDAMSDFYDEYNSAKLSDSVRALWYSDEDTAAIWSSRREDFILQQNTYECLYYSTDTSTIDISTWNSYSVSTIKGFGGLYATPISYGSDIASEPLSALAYGPETSVQDPDTQLWRDKFFMKKIFESSGSNSNWESTNQKLLSQTSQGSNPAWYVKGWLVNHAAPGYPGGFEGLMDLVLASYMNKAIAGDGHSVTGDINQNSEDIGNISGTITTMQVSIDSLSSTVESISSSVININETISAMTTSIESINTTITSIQHSIRQISDRVTACEVAIQELQPGEGGSTFTLI